MDTTPQCQEDQGSLITAPNVSITSDNRITTHPTGTEISAGMDQTDRRMRAAPVCSSTPVVAGKTAPQPGALVPSPAQVCTARERSQSLTSISRNPESFKSTTADSDPNSEDLCAAILLACLFCKPLDCLLATIQGCNSWIWSLCTSMCGCNSTSLQPLPDATLPCGLSGCVDAHCCLCDICNICDICRQTTECLDFAMEISQMLYH